MKCSLQFTHDSCILQGPPLIALILLGNLHNGLYFAALDPGYHNGSTSCSNFALNVASEELYKNNALFVVSYDAN